MKFVKLPYWPTLPCPKGTHSCFPRQKAKSPGSWTLFQISSVDTKSLEQPLENVVCFTVLLQMYLLLICFGLYLAKMNFLEG